MSRSSTAPVRRGLIARLRRNKRGVAAVEFAIAVSSLTFLFFGLLETSRFIMLYLKAQHAAVAVSDLVTRDKTINEAQVTDLFSVVAQIIHPFPVGANSNVVVTAMGQPAGQPASIYWQRSGAGSMTTTSSFGAGGSSISSLPAGITLRDDQTLVAVELFYQYDPWIFDFFGSYVIKRMAYFRPRIGALLQVDP